MEENLKKALAEMLVLALLYERDHYALELSAAISERSGGAITITFPYAILYRMIEQQYIQELPKRIAPDGRRRQYYQITEQGWRYVDELTGLYRRFIGGVELLLEGGEAHGE